MKAPTVFETTIIGFFVGIIVSTYSAYSVSAYGFQGSILHGLSWGPVADMFSVPGSQMLFVTFVVSVVAYMVYGALFGILIKRGRKVTIIAVCVLLALGIGGIVEQRMGIRQMPPQQEPQPIVESVPNISRTKPVERYFGVEAHGDLNNDTKEDIAFFISRDDDERGKLYYLAAALKTDEGHTGTNLVFLGDKVKPIELTISNQIISIQYTGGLLKQATSTLNILRAQVIEGRLVFMENRPEDVQASTTVR